MTATILSALANQTRLQLLICLANGEKNVTELIGNCKLSQSAVSQHLEKLRSAGLVTTKREGKEIYYQLIDKKTAKMSETLLKFAEEIKK